MSNTRLYLNQGRVTEFVRWHRTRDGHQYELVTGKYVRMVDGQYLVNIDGREIKLGDEWSPVISEERIRVGVCPWCDFDHGSLHKKYCNDVCRRADERESRKKVKELKYA